MTRPDPDAILAALDPEQRAAAEALHGPVVVLAGAGTGKTRAITHRLAHGVATGELDPRRCLAVTFTTRAAGQMRGRLAALGVDGVQARTFHAAALRQLRFFWPRVVGGAPPEILPTKARLVAAAASRERVATDPAVVRDLAAEIEWAKAGQVVPDAYPAAAAAARRGDIGGRFGPAQVARVYAAYEAIKTERHEADFEDVLLLTVGILDERPDVADEVRRAYRWFTVDEYQDVNPLQQRLLDLWLGERDDLCVVGDAAQTIYTFAGATPAHLLGFRARYPHATEVRLVRSYRCSPQIVSLANAVLGSAVGPAAQERLVLRSEAPDGDAPQVVDYRDEREEAEGVATRIAALVAAGTPPRDIAVLYRVNAASEAYEEALGERGVAVDLRGAERFFDRPEVRQAITLLRGAARGEGVGDDGLVAAVHAVLAGMGWTPDPATAGTGATGERWANLARLATLAADLAEAAPEAGLDDLVADLAQRAEHAHVPAAEAVTLASLHAAKGLEWPVVFLVGLTDGMLPISHADTPERVEEERRLFYVGVTRAARLLVLTWAEARAPGGRRRARSRFLDDIAGQAGVPASAPRVVRGSGGRGERRRRGPAVCRVCGKALVTGEEKALGRCRGCPSSYDEALLERLKAWRKEEAGQREVPAYVVFTDRTLLALAELDHGRETPWRRDDLLEVSGIGAAKLEAYGDTLLALLSGDG